MGGRESSSVDVSVTSDNTESFNKHDEESVYVSVLLLIVEAYQLAVAC